MNEKELKEEKRLLDLALTDSQKLALNIVTMNTAINDIQTDLREIEKIVVKGDGNQIPLVEQVRNNTTFVASIRHWAQFLFGALIIQTLSFGTAVIWAAIKLLPVLERIARNP